MAKSFLMGGGGWGNRQQQEGKAHYRDWLLLCTLFSTLYKVTQICPYHCGLCIMILDSVKWTQKGRDRENGCYQYLSALPLGTFGIPVYHVTCESLPFMDNDHVEQWQRVSLWGVGGGETGSNKKEKHITGIGFYCAHCSVLCIKWHRSVHIIVACV